MEKDNRTDISLRHKEKTIDPMVLYSVLKSEKIASALYLVTDMMSEEEPIRQRLRESAIDIVSYSNSSVLEVKDLSLISRTKIVASLNKITSLLRVAAIAELVSISNVDIISRECSDLATLFNSHVFDLTDDKSDFDRSYFSVGGKASAAGFYDRIRDTKVSSGRNKNIRPYEPDKPSGGSYETIGSKQNLETPSNINMNKRQPQSLTDRLEKISSMFKLPGAASEMAIKDIYMTFSGISEKTIQRDLIHLVSRGLLEKRGERRWSRYSLPS